MLIMVMQHHRRQQRASVMASPYYMTSLCRSSSGMLQSCKEQPSLVEMQYPSLLLACNVLPSPHSAITLNTEQTNYASCVFFHET